MCTFLNVIRKMAGHSLAVHVILRVNVIRYYVRFALTKKM